LAIIGHSIQLDVLGFDVLERQHHQQTTGNGACFGIDGHLQISSKLVNQIVVHY
jgi:hypothetical protein